MRAGGGKQKGSAFERKTCKALSLWVSQGELTDLFWRTAMSGGRATIQGRKGVSVRQMGDICAVSPEGHVLTDAYYLENKFVKDLDIVAFIISGKGKLAKFWRTTYQLANKQNRTAILIAKQNNAPTLLLAPIDVLVGKPIAKIPNRHCDVFLFDELLKKPFLEVCCDT